MRHVLLSLTSVMLLAGCQAEGPDSAAALDVPAIETGDISIDTLKSVTQMLTSDEVEGRAPGTAGEAKTLALHTEQFRREYENAIPMNRYGTVGEIATRSSKNMKGYWNNPEATARSLRDGIGYHDFSVGDETLRLRATVGIADLALGFFPELPAMLAAEAGSSSMQLEPLWGCEYVCVMRRGHPLAKKKLTLDAFCAARHLLVSFSGRPYGFTDEALASPARTSTTRAALTPVAR